MCQHITACMVSHTSASPVLCQHFTVLGASHLTTAYLMPTHHSMSGASHLNISCFVSTHHSIRRVTPRYHWCRVTHHSRPVCRTAPRPVLCHHITALGSSNLTTTYGVTHIPAYSGCHTPLSPVLWHHITVRWCLTPRYRLFCVNTSQSVGVSHLATAGFVSTHHSPSVRHTAPPPVLCQHITVPGASHHTTACFVSTHYRTRCVTPRYRMLCVTTPQPGLRLASQSVTLLGVTHHNLFCVAHRRLFCVALHSPCCASHHNLLGVAHHNLFCVIHLMSHLTACLV